VDEERPPFPLSLFGSLYFCNGHVLLLQAHAGESMFQEDVAVVVNGQMQSSLDDFLEWIQDEFDYRDDR
jgi:hypothetical protein